MTKWFEYDWYLNNVPAGFSVDLEFLEDPGRLSGYDTLIFMNCSSLREKPFTHAEVRILEKALAKAIKILGEESVYVGSVSLPFRRTYYFYTKNARLLVGLFGYCTSETRMQLECSKTEEPDFRTYFRFLCPDAIKYQAYNNKQYINMMKKNGDDVTVPRRVNLHLCFPSIGKTDPFLNEVKNLGFAIGRIDCNEAYQLPYSVTLHIISSLESEKLNPLTTKAILAAQKNAGVFDRLDSEFIPKRRF